MRAKLVLIQGTKKTKDEDTIKDALTTIELVRQVVMMQPSVREYVRTSYQGRRYALAVTSLMSVLGELSETLR